MNENLKGGEGADCRSPGKECCGQELRVLRPKVSTTRCGEGIAGKPVWPEAWWRQGTAGIEVRGVTGGEFKGPLRLSLGLGLLL